MTWTRGGHWFNGLAFPLNMISVFNQHSNRAPSRLTSHDTAQDLHGVFFDFHPSTRAIALLAARQFLVDDVWRDRESRRHPIKDGSKRWPMGFARGEKAQRHKISNSQFSTAFHRF